MYVTHLCGAYWSRQILNPMMEFRNLNQDVSPSDETNYHMMTKQDKCRQYTQLSDSTRMEISHKNIKICCQTPLNNYQMAGWQHNMDFRTSELRSLIAWHQLIATCVSQYQISRHGIISTSPWCSGAKQFTCHEQDYCITYCHRMLQAYEQKEYVRK